MVQPVDVAREQRPQAVAGGAREVEDKGANRRCCGEQLQPAASATYPGSGAPYV
jgi:hypothetical protein